MNRIKNRAKIICAPALCLVICVCSTSAFSGSLDWSHEQTLRNIAGLFHFTETRVEDVFYKLTIIEPCGMRMEVRFVDDPIAVDQYTVDLANVAIEGITTDILGRHVSLPQPETGTAFIIPQELLDFRGVSENLIYRGHDLALSHWVSLCGGIQEGLPVPEAETRTDDRFAVQDIPQDTEWLRSIAVISLRGVPVSEG